MTHRSSLLAAFGVVLGLAAGAGSVHAWTTSTSLTYLTFSGPVALPGVTLAPGTYAFELIVQQSASNLVAVRNKARTEQYFLGFTERVNRPRGMAARSSVSFAEAWRGEPTPIAVWYPPDSTGGLKFVYER